MNSFWILKYTSKVWESTHACVVKYIRGWLPSQAPRGGLASQTRTCMGTLRVSVFKWAILVVLHTIIKIGRVSQTRLHVNNFLDSLWIKPTDALNSNFIGITTLQVSGSLSAHHQEFLAVHRLWYILCSCDRLLPGVGWNSWWWAERLSETCRVVIPIKLEFSASVGFIHKENVTMHGHTILKFPQFSLPECLQKIKKIQHQLAITTIDDETPILKQHLLEVNYCDTTYDSITPQLAN